MSATPSAAAAAAPLLVWICCCWLLAVEASSAVAIDRRFGSTLEEIQQRSPYKFVREVILAAEGETKTITCAFDSLYTAGKHWKRTFYSPVTWYSYQPNPRKPAPEEPVTNGKVINLSEGKLFAYKIMNPMTVVPSSIMVLENVPMQLSGVYFICKTNLQTGSVQVFYLRVIKPSLYKPSTIGGKVQTRPNENLRLNCQTANNFPMTSVYWSRQKIDSKWRSRKPVLAWGINYELESVTMATAQYVYTCHVNNHLDPEWTADFRIELINTTKLRPEPITATFNGVQPAFKAAPLYGSSYTMSCRVKGEGIISFSWLRNGTELKPYADPNLYTYSSTLGQLHFTDLIVKKFRPADRGVYSCLARSDGGERRFQFDLKALNPDDPVGPSEAGGGLSAESKTSATGKQQRLGSGWGDPAGGGGSSGDSDSDAESDSADSAAPSASPASAFSSSSASLSAAPAAAAALSSGDGKPPRLRPPAPSRSPSASQRRVRRHRKRLAVQSRLLRLP